MVKGLSGVPADIRLESLPDPGNRFTLDVVIGQGISSTVYQATDSQSIFFVFKTFNVFLGDPRSQSELTN